MLKYLISLFHKILQTTDPVAPTQVITLNLHIKDKDPLTFEFNRLQNVQIGSGKIEFRATSVCPYVPQQVVSVRLEDIKRKKGLTIPVVIGDLDDPESKQNSQTTKLSRHPSIKTYQS